MIDQETVQRILDTAKIEEVIGDFVSLKKRGANHIGCCPFHNEKTPSFYVSPSKGIFKCFGCGEAGDVVAFLKKHEHYTYPEALRYLAEKYHIEIHEEEMTAEQKERQTERDALFHVSEFAQKYFADLLHNDEMGKAVGLSYFHGRGLSDEVIKNFGLGYCLDEWNNFTEHARKSGYSDSVLEKTGLTIFKESDKPESAEKPDSRRAYDRFRGRVMFPIYSISGRVLGFSGRVLGSGKQAAKYVNSPDSDIYNKSRILYGLFQARSAISKADKCYLVEGNIDVISMHQSGVENTVASCGTSLTTEQIRLIKRYTSNVTVLYDGDAAGIKAALRAVGLLFAEGMHVRVVLFPDGEDPDSYAQKYGSTCLQEYLASHEDNFVMFKTKVLFAEVKNDPIRKAELLTETANTIAMVSDLMERTEYVRQCAHLLGASEEAMADAVAKAMLRDRQKEYKQAAQTSESPTASGSPAAEQLPAETEAPAVATQPVALPPSAVERHLIKLLLNYGNVIVKQPDVDDEAEYTVAQIIVSELKHDELSFTHAMCQRIFEQCALMVEYGQPIDLSKFNAASDEQLRIFSISLMVDTYSISESWQRDKKIYTPSIESNLLPDLMQTLSTFKAERIATIIHEKQQQLMSAKGDAEMELLSEILALGNIRRQLEKPLNHVISQPHFSRF